ncbi:hypothetical protein [Pseudomonas sp. NBRC 111124]|uniref:hypothetical protein n=1 Tax=Pseudomonas sp. NBRC 111124 TaxID=1661039 RepID=UPI0012E190C2|nr:hypothetical protein [Pseudomonas sp. NBRC 111124]
MRLLIEQVWQRFNQSKARVPEGERDRLLASVATSVGDRLSFDLEQGVALDIVRVQESTEHLYSTSGHCVWFAPSGLSYWLCVYRREGNHLVCPEWVLVHPQAPLLIRGECQVAGLNQPGVAEHLAFSLSVPVPGGDIAVYEQESLSCIAWFPADGEVSRFIVLLQALQAVDDPGLQHVAQSLVYHPHPALRWQAFQILVKHSPARRHEYCALLQAGGDEQLNELVSGYLAKERA